jgi:hypothetical protein
MAAGKLSQQSPLRAAIVDHAGHADIGKLIPTASFQVVERYCALLGVYDRWKGEG